MFLRCIHLQTVLVIVASFVPGTVDSQSIRIQNVVGAQRGREHIHISSCLLVELPANTYVELMYYPNWMTNGMLIYSTYNRTINDPTNFTVYHSMLTHDTHYHNLRLVIKTVKPELATPYTCRLTPKPDFEKTIHFVVLDPVECPSSIIEYDVGDTTNISCSVNYHDSTLTYAPNIMWYRDGQPVPGQYTTDEANNRKTARLIKNVTLPDDDEEFVCIVDFVNSRPDYTDNCSTTFYVRHVPSEMSFYPPSNAYAPTNVAVGETINCTANGKPAPSIMWVDNAGNLLSDWGELFVTEEMRSWEQPIVAHCRANNIVTIEPLDGVYTFNVVEAKRTSPSSATGPMVSVYLPDAKTDIGEENVILRCSVSNMPPNNYIQWIYYPTWQPSGITIYSTHNNSNTDPTNFTVQPTTLVGDTYTLDLVINTLKTEFVAQYMCSVWPIADVAKGINVLGYLVGTVKSVSFYPPSSADAPITLEVGDVIECMANGRPEPTIEWYDPYGQYLSWERELVVTVDMRTWDQPIVLDCRAKNTIDNWVTFAFARGDYTFYLAEAVTVDQSSAAGAWVIAVAVIVPIIVVLTAIAIAAFFLIRHLGRKKPSKKTKVR